MGKLTWKTNVKQEHTDNKGNQKGKGYRKNVIKEKMMQVFIPYTSELDKYQRGCPYHLPVHQVNY